MTNDYIQKDILQLTTLMTITSGYLSFREFNYSTNFSTY
jgi:hypothetical protein